MKLALRALTLLCTSTFALDARAQDSAHWSTAFARASAPGTVTTNFLNPVSASIASYDDGGGAKLYTIVAAPNSRLNVVKWTGARWDVVLDVPGQIYQMGDLMPSVEAGAPVLYVTIHSTPVNAFTTDVWRYDGTTWTTLPTLPISTSDVGVFDDGTGPALFAAGYRWATPSTPSDVGSVLRWNGVSWDPIGPLFPGIVGQLATFDDGSGPHLYVGGVSGITSGSSVARWDGTGWNPVGSLPGRVVDLRVFHGKLHGSITNPPSLVQLNGNAWLTVDNVGGSPLEIADFGAGPRLAYTTGTNQSGVRFYDGATFSAPSGIVTGGVVEKLAFVDDGTTKRLYARGNFEGIGGRACWGMASTNGASWSIFGLGFSHPVVALARHDTLAGEALFAGGTFENAGDGEKLYGSARWTGAGWIGVTPSDPNLRPILTLRSIDLGAGPELYAGRIYANAQANLCVARLSGTTWVSAAPTLGNNVYALGSFDPGSGRRLVAGGNFGVGNQSGVAQLVAGAWQPLGTGLNERALAIESFDEGAGERLFVGGPFTVAGGVATGGVARWNGAAWSALGTGLTGSVAALTVFGGQLYAGGTVTDAGGVAVSNLARWSGSAWSDVPGGGSDGEVLTFCVHDDGRGDALYVGGTFSSIGGVIAYNLARFDGTTWEPVDGGLDGTVRTLASVDDDGDGDRELFAGGTFENTATFASGFVARLEGRPHYTSFCAGDGSFVDHTTPCPCGNDGAAGRGCANSFVADGALLEASGSTANDSLVLHVTDTPQSSLGIYLQHDAQGDHVFHDGVLCADGNLIRLRRHVSVGGESSFPDSTDTTTLAQRGSVTPGSGATRYYSCFYRNASTTFCPPATANVTNGVRVIW